MPFLQQGNSVVVTLTAGQSIAIGAPVDATANVLIPAGLSGGPSATVTSATQTFGPYAGGATITVVAARGQIEYEIGVAPSVGNGSTNAPVVVSVVTAGIFGDSIANEHFDTLNSVANSVTASRGSLHHWNVLTGGKIRFITNGGLSGTTTSGVGTNNNDANNQFWLGRIDAFIAAGPQIAFVLYPENDQTNGIDAAVTIASLKTIHAKLKAAGIVSIQATGLGDARGTDSNSLPGNSAAKMRGHFSTVMGWIREAARQGTFQIYEQYAPTANPQTGALIANYTRDSLLHPSALGAGAIAQYNQTRLTFPQIQPFEATGYPDWTNRIGNPFGSGTGGSNTAGFTLTAAVPDSYDTFSSGSPSAVSVTNVNRTDNRQGTYKAITATSGAALDRVGFTVTVNYSATWSAVPQALYKVVRGTYGDHWMVTTAGTSSGAQPAAMAAPSILGQTVTDSGGVVWTRVDTLNPGDVFEVIWTGQIVGCSSLTLGVQPQILVNISGKNATGAGRALNTVTGDLMPLCYSQTSATPRANDFVMRTMPISVNGSTITSLTVLFLMVMDSGLTATMLTQSLSLQKIPTV